MARRKKLNTFRFNNIMQCGNCPVRDKCPWEDKDIDGNFCVFEEDMYDRIMGAVSSEYQLNETTKLILESLISNLIVAARIHRDLKFNGLRETVMMKNERGMMVEVQRENLLKQGLHLEWSRIMRFLKEMKLTPKEQAPVKKQVDIRKMVIDAGEYWREKEKEFTGKRPLRKMI